MLSGLSHDSWLVSWLTGLQGKGRGATSLTPPYHFHPLHRHSDITRAITAKSSPLCVTSSRARTGNLWFPNYKSVTTKLRALKYFNISYTETNDKIREITSISCICINGNNVKLITLYVKIIHLLYIFFKKTIILLVNLPTRKFYLL